MEATTDGKKIFVRIPPPWEDPRPHKALKSIPGYKKWDPDSRSWHFPLSIDTCHALRRALGRDLIINPNLATWFRTEMLRREGLEELRAGVGLADLDRVAQ